MEEKDKKRFWFKILIVKEKDEEAPSFSRKVIVGAKNEQEAEVKTQILIRKKLGRRERGIFRYFKNGFEGPFPDYIEALAATVDVLLPQFES